MAQTTGIGWTDATWNPWHGCRKVSQGCKYCYMYRDKERYKQDPTVVMKSKSNFHDPFKWSFRMQLSDPSQPTEAFPGMKIFTCSWSDFFIEEADEWREEAWKIIQATPEFTYQILTKRPERIAEHLPADWESGYENVWLGVSAEDQEMYHHRVPILAKIPAIIRFISFEPLLGPIKLEHNDRDMEAIDWVIVGGESGNDKPESKYKYRMCEMEWIEQIVNDARSFEIPIFVKQTGTHIANVLGLKARHGQDIDEWPAAIQVQQFPNYVKGGLWDLTKE